MQDTIATDIFDRINAHVDSGQFASRDEVLRAALTALEQQQEGWAAIAAGIEDPDSGRYETFAEVDAELRTKHNIPRA